MAGNEKREAIIKSELVQTYLRELSATKETPAEKRFYDYYALWVINKKLVGFASSA